MKVPAHPVFKNNTYTYVSGLLLMVGMYLHRRQIL